MLDVYRDYYGFTGEPFRLGPDYRFSLHHESYANAKAYLEYAIYQGEGFIAVTGAPGTGKTTLISEILAGLDREKVQVATLTSTQLESRDLLYMVASSFEIHMDEASKANLLVEIESFLVRKIRNGQRAILIVDEAQGLSAGALEELRLLANLQYQYQLLLQIFLVGQEQLLTMIRAPGMEHLHQRLVAATSLEPLNFDATIDYVEHRLMKVGWQGDPAIEESALREVYRYSGGIARRINLIVNRLFLYGGMEEKHRFEAGDAQNVIQSLVEEFLLAPEPLLAETDIATASDAEGGGPARHLPRNHEKPAPASPAPKGDDTHEGGVVSPPAAVEAAKPSKPPNPPRTRDTSSTPTKTTKKESAPGKKAEPASHETPPRPTAPMKTDTTKLERPVPPKPAVPAVDQPEKKGGGKGIAMAVFLLVGAGAAYLLRDQNSDHGEVYTAVERTNEPTVEPPRALALKPEPAAESVVTANSEEHPPVGIVAKSAGHSEPANLTSSVSVKRGEIIREEASAPVDSALEVNKPVAKVSPKKSDTGRPAADRKQANPAPPDKVASKMSKPLPTKTPPVAAAQTEKSGPEEKHDNKVASATPTDLGKPLQRLPEAVAVVNKPAGARVENQRARLRAAAEQRFLTRQAQRQAKTPKAVPKPLREVTQSTRETVQSAALKPPAPVKKKPRLTPDEIAATLLNGRWSSRGKPASLLPSDSTYCNRQADKINCLSVPKNIKTQYGLALYKVETVLSKFSAQGHFEVSYRTLVKLVGAEAERSSETKAAGNGDWQITAYSMSCKLTRPDQISCLDGKGVSRAYRQTGLGRGH